MKTIRNILIILFACLGIVFAQDFGYTGGVQTYKVPVDGIYKLEVWGAKGGNGDVSTNGEFRSGGNGGYVGGNVHLSKGDTLYIVAGQAGMTGSTDSNQNKASYNGGGRAGGGFTWVGKFGYYASGGAGGGATHIALNSNRGELKNYSSYQNEVLIVAGGGSGALSDTDGGLYSGQAGNGSGGYSFGRGQDGSQGTGQSTGGGGGGWSGGTTSTSSSKAGTAYASSKLSNVSYVNNANSGNGKASITLVQEDPKYYIDLNGTINGVGGGNLGSAGKADVYINGAKVASGVTDFYTQYSNGTTFRMVATANPGYQLVSSSTCSGTVNGGNTGCNFEFKTQHTVTINKNNGTAPITVTLLYGETYTLPATPIKQGYTFQYYKRTA